MSEINKTELIFIPSPGMGHVVSTIEMAKLLIHQDSHITVSVLIIKRPGDTKLDSYIASLGPDSDPRIRFIDISNEQKSSQLASSSYYVSHLIEIHKDHVREYTSDIINSGSVKVAGFVIDMFCTPMIEVANEFNLPSYVFFTSGAAMLGLMFHLQGLRDDDHQDLMKYKDTDENLLIPSYINPVPSKVLPAVILDNDGGLRFLNHAKRIRQIKGIMVNTLLELESHALKSLSNLHIPPVYAVGPILHADGDGSGAGNDEHSEKYETIMNWLNDQPDSSVVYLCFGSMGAFEEDQVKEIAYALENSGQRFLWSLRRPASKDKVGMPSEYENPEEVLPEGFLNRTKDVGMVIGWAPQVAVLSHPAVGGFVSHCGWNSTLESFWCGVPMATWPLYAEQQVNAFELVKDLGLAVEIKIDYFNSKPVFVTADEIGNGIKKLMDPESEVRTKVKEMKEKSRMALKEGGSSHAFLGKFIEDVMKNAS